MGATFLGQEAGLLGANLGMKFRWCPPGAFTMGSPSNEPDRSATSEEQVSVTFTCGFWLGQFEVTQSEWQRVLGTTLVQQRDNFDSSLPLYGEGPQRPMYYVNHHEATEFCAQLTHQEQAAGRLPTGWEYRLPTEAQWEYACRAGATTATFFGNSLASTQANFNGNVPYNGGATGTFAGGTTDVGSYPENAWGLHDMHGNVWEWCADWYADKLPGGQDPSGPFSQASYRVFRGGGWDSRGQGCRAAYRDWNSPSHRFVNLGFRVAAVRVE
ncbi:MAG: formylglycine-generating enzyme family protein [Planctomycetaceae bacterium]